MEGIHINHHMKTNHFQLLSSNQSISDVLVIGYVMGGAVYPAEVLGMRPGHFYIQEPLHGISKYGYYKAGLICNMMDIQCNATNVADKEALAVLKAIYECDSTRYGGYLRAWQLRKLVGDQSTWQGNLEEHCGSIPNMDCRGKLLSQCSHSISKVINTPRISLQLATRLMKQLPKLKIIHILRDPRAIMYSYLRGKWPFKSGEKNTALSLCQRLKEDMTDSSVLKKYHPGRILTVFHEHLATSPEEVIKKIFDFVGYTGADDVKMKDKFGKVFHENSTLTAGLWRKNIPWSLVSVTNKACSNRYSALGYPGLRSKEELSDNTVPLMLPTRAEKTS